MRTRIVPVLLIIFLSSCVFSIDDYSEVMQAQETAVHSVLEISESGEVIAEGKVLSVSGLGSDCSVSKGQCYFSMKVEGVIVFIHYLSDYDPDRTECLNSAASEQAIKVRGGDHVKLFGKYLSAGSISTCGDLDYYIEILPSKEPTHTIISIPTMINPTATTQAISPSETSRPTHTMLPGTPMGDGVLTDQVGFHMSELMHSFSGNLFTWLMYDDQGRAVIVYAGVNTIDQQQGELIVVREDTIWDRMGDHIKIPTRSGRPEIIDAVGKRLIIETEMGDIFYFDVPSGKFANSLTETLATMTPGPTLTPRVTPTPRVTSTLLIPEIPLTVFFPANYTLIKNDELHRRGSFLSYDFVRIDEPSQTNSPPFPSAPYFNEIQFFTEDSITHFVNYCATTETDGGESFCNLGNYPDLETYYGQRESFQNLSDYENYKLEKFGDRYYFTSPYFGWRGSYTKIKEYTTFVGDVKIDIWISLASYMEYQEEQVLQLRSTQSDQLFRLFYLDTN